METWALDLDGVLWRGAMPIPGAADAIARLRARRDRVFFLTNNAAPTVAEHLAKLEGMGVAAAAEDLLTSAQAAATLLEPGSTALACAGPGVREALGARGVRIVEAGPADAVVVGWHREFDFSRLAGAADAVRRGRGSSARTRTRPSRRQRVCSLAPAPSWRRWPTRPARAPRSRGNPTRPCAGSLRSGSGPSRPWWGTGRPRTARSLGPRRPVRARPQRCHGRAGAGWSPARARRRGARPCGARLVGVAGTGRIVRAVAAQSHRRAHNPKAAGSNPAPATSEGPVTPGLSSVRGSSARGPDVASQDVPGRCGDGADLAGEIAGSRGGPPTPGGVPPRGRHPGEMSTMTVHHHARAVCARVTGNPPRKSSAAAPRRTQSNQGTRVVAPAWAGRAGGRRHQRRRLGHVSVDPLAPLLPTAAPTSWWAAPRLPDMPAPPLQLAAAGRSRAARMICRDGAGASPHRPGRCGARGKGGVHRGSAARVR